MTSKVEALDHLIDALVGQDVPRVSESIAGSIEVLAMAISEGAIPMGGGSASGPVIVLSGNSVSAPAQLVTTDNEMDSIYNQLTNAAMPVAVRCSAQGANWVQATGDVVISSSYPPSFSVTKVGVSGDNLKVTSYYFNKSGGSWDFDYDENTFTSGGGAPAE